MSIEALNWARKVRVGSTAAKLVLIALADYADENGYAYPSQKTLGEYAEMTDRSVRTHLKYLEEAGLIRREARFTGGSRASRMSDGYHLSLEVMKASNRKTLPPEEKREATGNQRRSNRKAVSDKQLENSNNITPSVSPPAKKRAVAMPVGWQPTDKHAALARKEGVSLEEEADQFRDHHAAKGSTFKDWNLAFNTWLRTAGKWQRERGGGRKRQTSGNAMVLSYWDALEDDESEQRGVA